MKKPKKDIFRKVFIVLALLLLVVLPLILLLVKYEIADIFALSSILFIIIWLFVGIIIHEAGHLIFGLLTGYRFISFQVGRTLIQKPTNKPLKIKRIPFNGLGGQCLMIPKDLNNKSFFLFNYGGIIINLVFFLLLFSLLLLRSWNSILTSLLISGMWMQYLLAVLNALPFIGLTNDGYNHRLYKNNPEIYQKILLNLQLASALNDGLLYQDLTLPPRGQRLKLNNSFDTYTEIMRFFMLLAKQDNMMIAQIKELYQRRGSLIPIYGTLIEILHFITIALYDDKKQAMALYHNFKKEVKKQLAKEKTGIGGIAHALVKWLGDNNIKESKTIITKVLRKAHRTSYLAEEEQIKMLANELTDQIKRAENPALIILASKSPRRKEILQNAHIHFDVVVQDVDETFPESMDPRDAIQHVATTKAMAVYREKPKHLVIGADTIVYVDNMVLGKPKDTEDAIQMLMRLQGQTHQVITGVCIIYQNDIRTFAEVTEVTFASMSLEEIQDYVSKENVLDKAGAYAIQGMAGRYITGIKGEYYNVVGLPIASVYQNLKERLKGFDLCALSLSEVEKSEQH